MKSCLTHHGACDCREAMFERLDADLIEATAELIYLRIYGIHGGRWEAVETKNVWLKKAREELIRRERTR